MPKYIEKAEQLYLPVIPSRGIIAFPSVPLVFEIEREFSVSALNIASEYNNLFFLLCQKDPSVDNPTCDDLYSVGTVCKVKQTAKTPDGAIRIIAEGVCRAIVKNIIENDNLLFANIISKTVSLEKDNYGIKTEALMRDAVLCLENMTSHLPANSTDIVLTAKSIKNPGQFADFIASSALMKFEDKQTVLEQFEPLKRLDNLVYILEKESKILSLETSIHKKVCEAIDDNQRDYYLREQLKVIQSELGGTSDDEADEYFDRIENTKLPEYVKEKLLKEVSRLSKSPFGSPEATVLRNYLDICLEIPFGVKTKDRIDTVKAKSILDKDHYGLKKPKERILEYLAVKQLNPDAKHQIICFVGPPGVGKTSLGASIAKAMNRKFVRVSLGGIKDEAEIRGHRKTYVAAMPGRIINALTQAKTMNPVMLLDEIDKLCSDMRGDPASALLEVLDGEQNSTFRDHFIEMQCDLSDVFFIATANSVDSIPAALLDRLDVIELNTYTKPEKTAIAQKHLIPKELKRHGLTKKNINLSKSVIELIIDGYTRESGVRNLEKEIASIFRKAAKIIVEQNKDSVTVNKANLSDFLGPKKFLDLEKQIDNEIGVVNGLAYTSCGGDMLKIETALMSGTGKLELTGTLGDVMKESAKIAVSYIRAHSKELNVDEDFYKNKDIHIHVPEGATPKDGPSAGVTILSSLVSTLSDSPARCDTAMTGELTLTGRVLPIGGLKEKSTAAWSNGIKRIIIPYDNITDLSELDTVVLDNVQFIPCKRADEVLKEVLVHS